MSVIPLADAKDFLDVIHPSDDDKIQAILDGAEHEALDMMNRHDFTEFQDDDFYSDDVNESDSGVEYGLYGMPASVRTAILFLVQAYYQATPVEMAALRKAAFSMLHLHRVNLGA